MDHPPPLPSPPSAGWWLAWLFGILGMPGLGFGVVAAVGERSDAVGPVLLLSLFGGLVLHVVASIRLADRIAASRTDPTRRRATGGLIVGLLFGGWAVMFAIVFVGCLATLMGNIGR